MIFFDFAIEQPNVTLTLAYVIRFTTFAKQTYPGLLAQAMARGQKAFVGAWS